MGYPIKKDQTARPLLFRMIDSADHVSGKEGLSPVVVISKDGGAFGTPDGAVTEIDNGWYQVAADADDADTLGLIALKATDTGADECSESYLVVGYDPYGDYFYGRLSDNVQHGGTGATLEFGSTSGPAVHCANSGGDAILLESTGGNGNGLSLAGNGAGSGLSAVGGATADGIKTRSGATSGYGFCSAGAQGGGRIWGNATNSYGMLIASAGNGHGLQVTGGDTGSAIRLDAGSTSGAGIKISTTAGHGIEIQPGDWGNGISIYCPGSGNGIDIYCNQNNAIYGLSGNSDAMVLYAGGTGIGMHLYGGQSGGEGLKTVANAGPATTLPDLEVGLVDDSITDDTFDMGTLTAPATGIVGMIQQTWREKFAKSVYDSDDETIIVYRDDGTTPETTQDATVSGAVKTRGAAT